MQANLNPDLGLGPWPEELWPDLTHVVTEDDTPVESWYQERQMSLLGATLNISWQGPGDGRPFLAGTDIGVFGPDLKPIVPDLVLGLDVQAPQLTASHKKKGDRSWFTFRYGPPLLGAEIVSTAQEGTKLSEYAALGVRYVVIWDPLQYLSRRRLRIYRLEGQTYRLLKSRFIPEMRLGLKMWRGTYMGIQELWLRWCDENGNLLASPEEAAQDVRSERALAEAERARADTERARAERLAERLRALGLDDT
ncbi:MAG TPA: Uma2 family endonuclease [Candidatus Xenobia bacterium]|jgi:hypothetical protein